MFQWNYGWNLPLHRRRNSWDLELCAHGKGFPQMESSLLSLEVFRNLWGCYKAIFVLDGRLIKISWIGSHPSLGSCFTNTFDFKVFNFRDNIGVGRWGRAETGNVKYFFCLFVCLFFFKILNWHKHRIEPILSLELGTRLAFSASQYLADALHRVNIWDTLEKLFITSNLNLHFWCEFWEAILHSFEEKTWIGLIRVYTLVPCVLGEWTPDRWQKLSAPQFPCQ